mgnify:CR=1 FL=1
MAKQYSINQNFVIALSVLSLYNCRLKKTSEENIIVVIVV